MPRRNRPPRRRQRRRYAEDQGMPRAARAASSAAPLPLDKMVLPKGRCFYRSRSGKLIFVTEKDAQTALRHAQQKRKTQPNGHVESRYYECPEGGCGGFHLTSRETFEERGKAS
jgi:hypothetical protein